MKGASYATYLYQVDERWAGRSGSILFCNTLCDEDKKDAGETLGPILIFANPNPVDINYMQVQVIPDSLEAAKLHDGVLPDILIFSKGYYNEDLRNFLTSDQTAGGSFPVHKVNCEL